MKVKFQILATILFCLMLGYQQANANRVFRQRMNHKGLYSSTSFTEEHGVSVYGGIGYYYGDIDHPGIAFKDGWIERNMCWGVQASYHWRPKGWNPHINWRFSGYVGRLSGDNKDLRPINYRSFDSWIGELSAVIEYYPSKKVKLGGFFLFGGAGVVYSHLNYDFNFFKHGGPAVDNYQGERNCFVPVLLVGLGYNIRMGKHFRLGFEVSGHQALVDIPAINLDGYPFIGNNDFYIGKQSKWLDGWFSAGVRLVYRWESSICRRCDD
ncbi:MAG: hypothetical protein IJU35_01690 [Paludibacteraceae bacterium]|nr:hypothetical protein [Paludibacteraceae bacterium]